MAKRGSFDPALALASAAEAVGVGEWRRANCRYCLLRKGTEDQKASFGIHDSGYFHCFRCGARGFLDLGHDAPDPAAAPKPEVPEPTFLEDFVELGTWPGDSALLTLPARRYLEGRGVRKEIWHECQIGICTEGYFAERIIVPVIDPTGAWRGWVGRAWSPDALMRYRYPRGMKRGELFWNERALYEETDAPVFIVEGCFDALPHYPHAVACLGKPSRKQTAKIAKARRPVVVALDGDAWQEGLALSMLLKLDGVRATSLQLPPKTDPGNIPPSELLTMARAAI